MGDSACLMQPFCYASGISNESNQSNPIHALGQSISFGRFASEPLAWEKWSTFSHNRYVEEAERYSRPGSVAQKKAFFEAHYKKLAAQKAAALLEQANNAASDNVTKQEDKEADGDTDTYDSQEDEEACPTSNLAGNEEPSAEVINSEPKAVLSVNSCDSNSTLVEEAHQETENRAFVKSSTKVESENQPEEVETHISVKVEFENRPEEVNAHNSMKVELENQPEEVDTHKEAREQVTGTSPMGTSVLKKSSNSDEEVLATMNKKKPPVSSGKLLKDTGTTKFNSTPAKLRAPTHNKDNAMATPMSNKPALNSIDKKRSTPRSINMSVNFTPIRELNRLTASVMRKFESARGGAASSKASKDSSTPLRTPTMASKNELRKHPSMTPLTEKKSRTKTPIGSSTSGGNTGGPKWRLLSTENKMRSPMISSPFSLRTEERAARRKKKLEEKFNANEAQKVQLHTKLKEKAETEIRKLRQSFCFKARPLPDFYKERKLTMNDTNKYPLTHPESPRKGTKLTPSVVGSKTSVTPQRPSVKNNGTKNFLGKNGRTPSHPLTPNPRMIITHHENTSPNIQHGNQNDRNYKNF